MAVADSSRPLRLSAHTSRTRKVEPGSEVLSSATMLYTRTVSPAQQRRPTEPALGFRCEERRFTPRQPGQLWRNLSSTEAGSPVSRRRFTAFWKPRMDLSPISA
eukprot:scaffold1154_cov310-Pinguiococcus_pyrenoidosus.AAC.22